MDVKSIIHIKKIVEARFPRSMSLTT